jgi:hypothetical protein
MSVHVVSEIVIGRPREVVAAFTCDPGNDRRWIAALARVDGPAELPLKEGDRVTRVARFLGRDIEYVLEMERHEPGRCLAMRSVKGPFAMHVTYEFNDAREGARMRIINRGDASGFYALAAPLLSRMVKSNVDKDLRRLKSLLEGVGRPV